MEVVAVATRKAERVSAELQRVVALDLSSDNRVLLYGGGIPGESGGAFVVDWESKRVLSRQTNFSDWVTSVALERSGRRFVAGSADGRALICAITGSGPENSSAPILLGGHTAAITSVAWSPDA